MALLKDGHQTPQEMAEAVPGVSEAVFAGWYWKGAGSFDPKTIRRRAKVVSGLAARRKMLVAVAESIEDMNDPDVDVGDVAKRTQERLVAITVPDSPPEDPAVPIDVFMARGGADDDYDWIIPGLLERRERMLVTAVAGVGKSTLLRQIALCTAAGIHPFTGRPIPPKRVLLLDLENSERQVRRKIAASVAAVGPFNQSNLHVAAHPRVIDVTTSAGKRWMAGQAAICKPELIVGGPIYRFYKGGDASKDMGGKDKATEAAEALDEMRDRWECAVVMEAHPPKGSEYLSPHGSAVWEWWPEFGIGLKPEPEDPNLAYWTHYRRPRDERDWPTTLRRGGAYGFEVR
jgi:replicative DNA helicase